MRTPSVAVIMGSSSDWNIMSPADEMMEQFAIHCEARIISAHRGTDAAMTDRLQ